MTTTGKKTSTMKDRKGRKQSFKKNDTSFSKNKKSPMKPKVQQKTANKNASTDSKNSTQKTSSSRLNECPDAVYVTKLPESVTESELEGHFTQFGRVANVEISEQTYKKDKKSISRRYAYVTFENAKTTKKALLNQEQKFGENDLLVRPKWVSVDKDTIKDPEVYVRGLHNKVSTEDIESHFSKFGSVARVIRPGKQRYAFVAFETDEAVRAAVNADSHVIVGKPVTVRDARKEKPAQTVAVKRKATDKPSKAVQTGSAAKKRKLDKGVKVEVQEPIKMENDKDEEQEDEEDSDAVEDGEDSNAAEDGEDSDAAEDEDSDAAEDEDSDAVEDEEDSDAAEDNDSDDAEDDDDSDEEMEDSDQ